MESLQAAGTTDVPSVINGFSGYRRWADWRLRRLFHDSGESTRERLHASLALLPVDASQADYLATRLLGAAASELQVLRTAPGAAPSPADPDALDRAEEGRAGRSQLADFRRGPGAYDPDSPRWSELGGKVAEALVKVNPAFLGVWLDALRPVRGRLAVPLERIFVKDGSETEHDLATSLLVDYAADEPDRLARLLMAADSKAFLAFFPIAERLAEKIVPLLQAQLPKSNAAREEEADTEQAKDELGERQARAAVALVRLGHSGDVWPLLRHSADPRLRGLIVSWLSPLGADAKAIMAELDKLNSPASPDATRATRRMDAILFDSQTSTRRGAYPGPGDVRGRITLSRRTRARDRPARHALRARPRCWHPRRIGLDLAAVEAAREARDDRCPFEGPGPRRPPLVRQ